MEYNYYNPETDTDHTWEVNYSITAGERGNRRGHPDSWSRDWAPEMDGMEVTDENGVDITATLSQRVLKDIEEKCWEDAHEYSGPY